MNRHILKMVGYDRSKGVLTKADYVYMRDLLETVIEQLPKFRIRQRFRNRSFKTILH